MSIALKMIEASAEEIAAARRYWRQHFQKPTPRHLESAAQEEAIKAKHAGGRT